MTKLLTVDEIADALDTTKEHVIGLVHDGKLKYINVGRGTKRPRYRFTPDDLAEFVEANRKREEIPCPFLRPRTRRSFNTNSNSKVIGFAQLRAQRTDAKRKR